MAARDAALWNEIFRSQWADGFRPITDMNDRRRAEIEEAAAREQALDLMRAQLGIQEEFGIRDFDRQQAGRIQAFEDKLGIESEFSARRRAQMADEATERLIFLDRGIAQAKSRAMTNAANLMASGQNKQFALSKDTLKKIRESKATNILETVGDWTIEEQGTFYELTRQLEESDPNINEMMAMRAELLRNAHLAQLWPDAAVEDGLSGGVDPSILNPNGTPDREPGPRDPFFFRDGDEIDVARTVRERGGPAAQALRDRIFAPAVQAAVDAGRAPQRFVGQVRNLATTGRFDPSVFRGDEVEQFYGGSRPAIPDMRAPTTQEEARLRAAILGGAGPAGERLPASLD